MHITYNWENKEQRAKQAQKHTEECAVKYKKEIEECIRNTKEYSPNSVLKNWNDMAPTQLIVKDTDSVTAITKLYTPPIEEDPNPVNKMAVLNFASYKEPGGMFLQGSSAQEECLCHESFLYNVLRERQDYYDWNALHKNRAMYMNRALYSPNVIFTRNGMEYPCDVITCAAPNASAARKYQQVTEKENKIILKKRIKFVLDVAEDNKVDTLILGAFGCGVFGQDPSSVAQFFKDALSERTYRFWAVVFAVPSGNKNHDAFQRIFGIEQGEPVHV